PRRIRLIVEGVERDAPVLDVDAPGGLVRPGGVDEVPHLALDGHVGNQALHGLRVHPRHVARVRVAVRIAVLDVDEELEVVSPARVGVYTVHACWSSSESMMSASSFRARAAARSAA